RPSTISTTTSSPAAARLARAKAIFSGLSSSVVTRPPVERAASASQMVEKAPFHDPPSQPAVILRECARRVEVNARVAALSSPLEDRAREGCAYAGAPSSWRHEELSKPWCQFGAGREVGGHEVRRPEQLSLQDGHEN